MAFIKRFVLFILGVCVLTAHADVIAPPAIEPASTVFLGDHAALLWIAILSGIIILLLVAYHKRKK
ncbi:hypothetical protein [Legionella shakespearei]|uniref:LPXTG cell wall anchor domain-containing protein n=1 Tax=Legionella shakespearei DSM 23087 TaxID=1122169 RepID=A0A0W0YWM9_9GAMM|nr:hypothetical protein [Legionella shakespearei]KTD61276.1 hypothetical protein Lsha_1249 [Legionella shakespearei DSM 23087]